MSEDTAAHGIEKVIFKKLTHKGENKKGQLTANLELWEYIPQTITATKSSGSGSSKSSGSSSGSKSQSAQSNLSGSYKSYLSTKRGKSPAIDNASSSAALNKIAKLPY